MRRCIISLSKIAHRMWRNYPSSRMWRNHPSSQRNKKSSVRVKVGREGGGVVGKNFKKRKIGNSGGVQKIEGLGTLCQLQHKEPQQ